MIGGRHVAPTNLFIYPLQILYTKIQAWHMPRLNFYGIEGWYQIPIASFIALIVSSAFAQASAKQLRQPILPLASM